MVVTTDLIHSGGGGTKNPKQGNQMIEDRGKSRPLKGKKRKK